MRDLWLVLGTTTLISLPSAPLSYAQSNEPIWQVSTSPGGRQVAAIRTAGPTRGMSITCQGSAPMLLVAAAQNGKSAKANLELTGTVDGSTITVPMIWNPQAGAWWAIMKDRAALDLLAGASNSVFMAMNGLAIGTLPLTGSSSAIRTALAGCYSPPVRAMATSGQGEAASNPNSLPLRFGTYVRVGKKCGADYSSQAFIDEGKGGAGDYITGSIQSLRKSSANTYTAREDVGVQDTSVITAIYTIQDREHFTVKPQGEVAKSYVYCPLETLPLDQQQWPQNEWKKIQTLPIKPGYYQALTDVNGDGRLTCEYSCGYYLFRSDGIAAVSFFGSDAGGEVYRRVVRPLNITQTGALTYQVVSNNKDSSFNFEIRSATDFEEEDGEETFKFRPVDQAKIPAKYMPRL